jgi:hypothetical protein
MNDKQALGSKRLTLEERAEVVTLRRAGLHIGEISYKLGVNRNTVGKWIVKAGLPISRRPPIPEKKAKQMLALLRKRVERRKIGRMLGISHRAVREFANANGFAQPKKEPTKEQILATVSAILAREGSGAAIAKKYGVPYKRTLAMAHNLLQCERFLPTWKRPLESYFPSRPPEPMKKEAEPSPQHGDGEANFIGLVDFITKQMDGAPKDPDELSKLLLGICLHYVPKPVLEAFTIIERENVEKYFSVHISQALATLRQSENCAWKN